MAIQKKYVYVICLTLIAISIIAAALISLQFKDVSSEEEWPNNVTLITEVAVGLIITLIVLMITKVNELEIEKKITNVLDIVKEQKKIQQEKERQVLSSTLSTLQEIQSKIKQILLESELYKKSENLIEKQSHKDQIILECSHIQELSMRNLDDVNKISLEFFPNDTLGLIKTISNLCKIKPDFDDDEKITVSYENLKNMIDPRIIELTDKLKLIQENVSQHLELKSNVERITISVSSDRTVYPLNSTMHMRAKLSDVVECQKILFEVYNSNRKLLLSQNIDPTNNDYPDLAEANLFQACFKMEGEEWKVGETYIVRATHDSSFAEDSFLIDQRTPVIQTDKSVYMIGSDMILTVIDPDADMDNDIAELVGDKDDSKIIIKSKYGKIDGYKLRETGDSTGIFQGIVGILGIRKDGTTIKQNFNGKIIDKIQGTGITDGFIGGSPGDEITIQYKNNSSVVHLTIFISNFGAVIEMDKKTYQPNDKVFITIVAPDFSFNSKKINDIGQNSESVIRIKTSMDELAYYKLVETGPDTGIFSGMIQLSEILENKKSIDNLGPTDGVLYCNKNDFIEVSFSSFENVQVVGKSEIKS